MSKSRLRVGYILKRFPRASETFIAQEILQLERMGVKVTVLALRPNDQHVPHRWLSSLEAEILEREEISFSDTWRALKTLRRTRSEQKESIERALILALDHPVHSGRRYLSEAVWAARVADELGLEHIHAHFANHPTFVAMLTHLISGVPFSFTTHAEDIYAAGPTPSLWWQLLRYASFAVTVCEANRRYLTPTLGKPLIDKVHRVYNGVDLESFQPAPSVPPGPVRVLAVARLVEKKGLDVLVDAIARLRGEGEEISCTIVGSGPEEASLFEQVNRLGLSDVCALSPALPQEDVARLMREASLFALPCRVASDGDRDALPTVLLEAMATGLPCIGTPINGVQEIIRDGETGALVRENDPGSLADAIRRLGRDPQLRERMGRSGRAVAEQQFDLRKNVSSLLELIEGAAQGSARQAGRRPRPERVAASR